MWRKEIILYIKSMKENGYKTSQIKTPSIITRGTYAHRVWCQELKKEKLREEAQNIDIKKLMTDALMGGGKVSKKEEKILKVL